LKSRRVAPSIQLAPEDPKPTTTRLLPSQGSHRPQAATPANGMRPLVINDRPPVAPQRPTQHEDGYVPQNKGANGHYAQQQGYGRKKPLVRGDSSDFDDTEGGSSSRPGNPFVTAKQQFVSVLFFFLFCSVPFPTPQFNSCCFRSLIETRNMEMGTILVEGEEGQVDMEMQTETGMETQTLRGKTLVADQRGNNMTNPTILRVFKTNCCPSLV